MNTMMTKLALAAALATSMSVPVFAQQADWSQRGDYYAPGSTVVQQPTAQELNEFRHGDYYAPNTTAAHQPTARELNEIHQGDFYAPTAN